MASNDTDVPSALPRSFVILTIACIVSLALASLQHECSSSAGEIAKCKVN